MADVLARNSVTISGTGTQPMLFAHGFGCDQNMWRSVAPAFARDYQLVLFDHVGSGTSDRAAYDRNRYGTLDGYASDLLEICEALDLHDVILVGHSVSATIAWLAAIREPERFSKLILVTPSPRYINDPPSYVGGFNREDVEGLLQMMERNYMGWASFLAPVVMGSSNDSEELERSFCANDPVIARHFAEVTFFSDHREQLQHVQTPSLILQCSDDALAPVSVGQYLHEQLAGSSYHQLAANGHCPHVSHPEETIAAIRAYLAD